MRGQTRASIRVMRNDDQPELKIAVVGSHALLPFEDEQIAAALEGVELVVSVGDIDLERIARVMPAEARCLYVLGDRDDGSLQAPPRCHLLNEKGALVCGFGFVGVSGGSEFDEGELVLVESDAARLVSAIEAIPDYDILVSHAPPPTAEADTGDGPPLLAFGSLYAAAPPIYHFYAHSDPGGSCASVEGVLAVGVCGLLQLTLRRPS